MHYIVVSGVVRKMSKTDLKKEYVRIDSEQYSTQHSFLFWKPNSQGYTADINKAGLYEYKKSDLFFSIKKSILLKHFTVLTIIEGSHYDLKKMETIRE